MNDVHSPFDEFKESDLSEDDLAILRAFEAMESWPPASMPTVTTPLVQHPETGQKKDETMPITSTLTLDDEMRHIFLEEAGEDLKVIRQALHLLEESGSSDPARFTPFQRVGHKLHGTAGAIDFSLTALIAGQIEELAERVSQHTLSPRTALLALSSAITALEDCLQQITTIGQEPERELLLAALTATYQDLGIDLTVTKPEPRTMEKPATPLLQDELPGESDEETLDELLGTGPTVHIPAHAVLAQEPLPAIPSIRVDVRRFAKLTEHTEHLIEQRSALENVLQQVDVAWQEFLAAQARLQQLEPLLSIFLTDHTTPHARTELVAPPSSLISRILSDNPLRRTGTRQHPRRPTVKLDAQNSSAHAGEWDEMDIERYNEKDKLLHSLKDAMADVQLTTTRLHTAYTSFVQSQQEYLAHISSLRRAALAVRQAPLSTLLPRLRRVVKMSALGQPVQFDVVGEHIELDQELLEQLAAPLTQLLRTCIANAFILDTEPDEEKRRRARIWLHIRELSSEIALEIGFSMTIQGGAVDAMRDALARLGGHLAVWRNSSGGVSFLLHIPRSQGATQCLLVHVGSQQLIVPFAQVRRVLDQRQEEQALPATIYHLNELLGFTAHNAPLVEPSACPVLVIGLDQPPREVGVAVDQVLDEVELIVKPLKPYLQRPGIPGAAVDGKGCVVLTVDLPALIAHYTRRTQARPIDGPARSDNATRDKPGQIHVLVADDAAYLRHSVRQTLQHDHYIVREARDGMEALEALQEHIPHICLLDIEMPNLNGYDVLSMIRNTPAFAQVKVIMLTSRSSEKHRQQALDLGADAYLTKPCPQEMLLTTVRQLLSKPNHARSEGSSA